MHFVDFSCILFSVFFPVWFWAKMRSWSIAMCESLRRQAGRLEGGNQNDVFYLVLQYLSARECQGFLLLQNPSLVYIRNSCFSVNINWLHCGTKIIPCQMSYYKSLYHFYNFEGHRGLLSLCNFWTYFYNWKNEWMERLFICIWIEEMKFGDINQRFWSTFPI